MGALILPTSGTVYVDANALIYRVEAARLRVTSGLKTPDAIHAATALIERCTLFVTNDAAFRRVPGLNVAILSEIAAAP